MSLFNPSRNEVRSFFIEAWSKARQGLPATPLETIAGSWAEQHPEYHKDLEDSGAQSTEYTPEKGVTNPFLHLSMHLSISEQISIDQPPGIADAARRLSVKLGSEHEAQHVIMECLGEMLWTAQRHELPPDGAAYIDCILRAASR